MEKIHFKKRIKKSFLVSLSLAIAFVANKWFNQAWEMETDLAKWLLLVLTLVLLSVVIAPLIPNEEIKK